ncbi:DUF547 domain-containing protein [Gemmatimonas sp.]|uniref:DUF547 domain-containing protein n=1 Tax=Gemmatimonas sp. TaxID=1962908 RepID=UPI003983714D
MSEATSAPKTGAWLRLVIFVGFLLTLWLVARMLGFDEYISAERIGTTIRDARALPFAAAIFVVAYAVVATIGLPALPLTLAGGAIFGVAAGIALTWLGATLGATGAYLLARTLGGDALRRLLGSRAGTLDRLLGDGAFLTMLRLRLIPVVPFNALNFGAGLAGVRLSHYIAATAIGILPGTSVYTYFADSLLAGTEGARQTAFIRVAIAGVLLLALSYAPALAKRAGWISLLVISLATAAVSRVLPSQTVSAVGSAPAVDHSAWNTMLAAYVTDGLVDYNAFQRDPRFAAYLAQLHRVQAATLPRNEQLAYWINVYNAYTIELLNSRRERKSIRRINKVLGVTLKSPWAESIVNADGRTLTLDAVEHEIIRKQFKEPRIHVALVCAALGCPPLRSEAFTADRLNTQLDDQARRFLAQSAKNRVDVRSRTVYGSPIFTWYREDFGGSLEGVGAFWAKYLPPGPAQDVLRSGKFQWVDTDYDWKINLRR